ncbi:cysteine desulfurase IscS [Geothermobacter ehrlichii]|uniref:cysteine desulfurase n=1 Tax=Geothermobacter ehrlichii TaxID=213224 RepID=A0A5D3WIL1_9BACT|nr:cysteine desulfurase family protein [Geothermobacter ehrlichii]TYO98078.1 cysteine desulfurase IscS [Geothermobacter ehrlichii]
MKIGNSIYLDYQATTPTDPKVLAELTPYYAASFGNPHSAEHWFGWQAAKAVETARQRIAQLINADSDEIVFTSGATESNNLALLGLVEHYTGPRKKIFISSIEHKSILSICHKLEKKFSLEVVKIPVDNNGFIDIEWLSNNANEDTFIISIIAVNNEIGTVQNLDVIGKIARKSGAIFHSDASQAPQAMEIDVLRSGIDILSLSSHKIYGPKGIGAIYISRELQKHIEPIIYGGGQENGLRGGTLPAPLCVGMGMAAKLIKEHFTCENQSIASLRNLFFEMLQARINDINLNGPSWPRRHPGNINLCFPGINAQDLIAVLQPRIAASSGSACSSGIVEPSHVLRAIGCSHEEAQSSIRFSLGRMSTRQEVEEAVEIIVDGVTKLRRS